LAFIFTFYSAQEEEKRKEGTKVTVELFTKWKTAFDLEMAEKERIEKGLKKEDPKMQKPTGKECHSLSDSLVPLYSSYSVQSSHDTHVRCPSICY
jgi:hypothetical protein